MNIQKISAEPVNTSQPSFKSSFVTLSKKNLGEKIATNVVDTFNGKILPEIRTTQLQEANSVIEKTGVGSVIQKADRKSVV